MDNTTLLDQRYEIKNILGRGGLATTYLAFDQQTAQQCVIKCLSFQKIEEWKSWELFEREAKILKNLDHPQIPDYIDFFTIETEHDTQIYLVQEYLEGKSLAQLVEEGKHFTENEAIKIALGITQILEYLHNFSPAIIHRDIKPGNIMLSPDNRPFLIDFGAVRDKMLDDLQSHGGIPTIVGTYGFMPLEQTEGRAVPASDIYALGMTLIQILSHNDPSRMEKAGLRLDFRPHVNISQDFANILERMIAPDWHHRYQSVTQLRRDLELLQAGKAPLNVQTSPATRMRPWLKYLIAADILVTILIVAGIYFWVSRTPEPSVPSDNVNAPAPHTSTSGDAPVNPVSTPLPRKTAAPPSENIVYAVDGKIGVHIYRDFTYIPQGWPMGLSVGQSTAGGLDTGPYEELVREPEYRSENVLYGYLPLGNGEDQKISFVFDELDRPNWIAYVDKNNNEDLTDDGPPYRNEGTGIFAAEMDLQIEIVMLTEDTTIHPYHLWMWVIKDKDGARFYARCHYAGRIAIGEVVYEAVAFEQFQHKGVFRESGLWIDLNHDNELDKETEHFYDDEMIRINAEQYQLDLQYP